MKMICALAALLLFGPAMAPARTVNIEYILDASGSMLELMGDENKIEIAKQTLIDLIDRLPSGASEVNLNVGLRVYGHSTRGGDDPDIRCRDTVLEVPIAGIDVPALKAEISGIRARGWTPIAYSLEQAKNDFPTGDENDNIIILISDGKETCGGDPCAVAAELHKSGIKLKIHVVGFDIKAEEREQLECIAEAAGGNYYGADSAAELSRALGEAQEQVLKEESTSVRIQVAGPGKLRFDPADWVVGPPYRYRLESVADGKVAASGSSSLEDVMLSPGTYRLIWDQTEHSVGDTVLAEEIEIRPGQTTTLALNTGIHLVPASWIKEAPRRWYLKDPASDRIVLWASGTWDALLVRPGIYELWYDQWEHDSGDVLLNSRIEITEGKVTEFDVNTGVTIVPSDPEARAPYRWVLTDPESGKQLLWVSGRWGPCPVAPGRYSLSLRQTQHGHSLTELIPSFPVKIGQLVEIGL